MKSASNPEVKLVFDWFLSFIEPKEWFLRKVAIEEHLREIRAKGNALKKSNEFNSIFFAPDKMGWYLYLTEMILTAPTKYEPIQGARIVPIFERLGADFELLCQIGGINEKVKKLVSGKKSSPEPDSVLFEILVALLWKRNGWKDVSFIQEASPEKRPDIKASSGNFDWFIECKRLAGTSEYSKNERKKWQKMWWHLREFLVHKNIPAVLDIVFHVELTLLPDDFMVKQLESKLLLLSSPCLVISNEQWQVTFDTVNFKKAGEHLEKFYVLMPSNQLNELIAGHHDPHRGFTHVIEGETCYIENGLVNNKYLMTMNFAAGAFWHCDADASIEGRARDIRKHLAKAVTQLPPNQNCAIHIGLETSDGVLVEEERSKRIFNTVKNFDNSGKNLRWIYCHFFKSYAPPDQDWVFDETVHYFSHKDSKIEPPIKHNLVMIPFNGSSNSTH